MGPQNMKFENVHWYLSSKSKHKIKVSAIGVGRINEDEIRELTDDQEGHIFYLMSWESVQKFNRIFEKVSKKFENDACLPLTVAKEEIAWVKWTKALSSHGVTVRADNNPFDFTIE